MSLEAPRRAARALALSLACALLATAAQARSHALEKISVLVDGRAGRDVQSFGSGDALSVDIVQLCRALGGEPSWYQVSGRVFCSYHSKQMRLSSRSASGKLAGKTVTLPSPVAVRAGEAFVPLAFVLSGDFQTFLAMGVTYDAEARVLKASSPPTVVSLVRAPAAGKTVLELGLKVPPSYRVEKKSATEVDVVFRGGIIDSTQALTMEDGPLDEARLEQDASSARLVLTLASSGARVSTKLADSDTMLVVEVSSSTEASTSRASAASDAAAGASAAIPGMPVEEAAHGKVRVVVDAGHGGKDPGTTGRGMREKDITLAEAKDVAELLRDDGRFEVMMTRTTDVFVPLSQRSKLANDFKADLFVSIHVNHSGSSRERGLEVYFLSEKASDTEAAVVSQFENSVLGLEESKPQDMEAAVILSELEKTDLINDSSLLAGYVAKAVDHSLQLANRGVKQAQFYVLHWTRAPAVLVETAYLSNRRDASNLASRAFRRDLARKIADGVIAYAQKKDLLQ